MFHLKKHDVKVRGFSIIGGIVGTLAVTSLLVLSPKVASVKEYFEVRSAAGQVANNLIEAQRLALGHDVDRRIRITSEHGYVREKRAGAGWLFEEAYVMPEGFEIEGPATVEFWSHSALGPVAAFTISGPGEIERRVITKKSRGIEVE